MLINFCEFIFRVFHCVGSAFALLEVVPHQLWEGLDHGCYVGKSSRVESSRSDSPASRVVTSRRLVDTSRQSIKLIIYNYILYILIFPGQNHISRPEQVCVCVLALENSYCRLLCVYI